MNNSEKWSSKFVKETNMGLVSMETHVTLDIRWKFPLKTVVIFLIVKRDIQGFAVGIKSMGDVNLHHFANLDILTLKTLRI